MRLNEKKNDDGKDKKSFMSAVGKCGEPEQRIFTQCNMRNMNIV